MKGGAAAAVVGAALVFVCCGGAAAVVVAPSLTSVGAVAPKVKTVTAGCGSTGRVTTVAAKSVPGFTTDQVNNAAAIIRAGQDMGVPPRGLIVGVATAMQESGLRNLANPKVPSSMQHPEKKGTGSDHDSVGLFQQRPSPPEGAGSWGTVRELMTPDTSARKFFGALLKVSGWEQMPLSRAAQAVQRSAFPGAYAKHEGKAGELVGALTDGANRAGTVAGTCASGGQVTAGGWTQPVPGGLISGWRTKSRPTHQGVDLEAANRTPIKAAAAGRVIKMRCNAVHANTGAEWGCDRPGHPKLTKGCGWYVDIEHADKIVTRYCHMIVRPLVSAGQTVTAGQQIGWSGSSGHSSGPHLHFEVHRNGDTSSQGAIDPVAFMAGHGAALGAGSKT